MRRAWGGLFLAFGLLVSPGAAGAAVPFVDIGAPSGPLTKVAVGNDLSCQAQHTGDSALEFYPSTATPGDCGTFLSAGGTLYAPDFANHDRTATSRSGETTTGGIGSYTPFSAVSQSAKTGSGTSADPFKVVTVANAGGLTLTQTDTYVTGQESYRTEVTVRNGGAAAQSIVLYRAGDCYLQNTDSGFGFAGQNNGAGCSATANNTPPGRIEEFLPITAGASFLEAQFGDVWGAIGAKTPFPNLCAKCTANVDNGAGISWSATVAPGQSATFAHFTTFSPTGRAGPPAPPQTGPTDVEIARTPTCVSIPGVVRNRTARVPGVGTVVLKTQQVDDPARPVRLNVSIAGRRGGIASVTFQVNGRTVLVSQATTTSVPVTFLRIGSRTQNRIVAAVVLANGRTVSLTQRMVILRCHVPAASCRRLGDGRALRCSSRTPLSGRRVNVTVTRSATETARGGPAVVTRGRYTITVRSATPLGAGVYAYKAVVRGRPGQRFQSIRLVTVT